MLQITNQKPAELSPSATLGVSSSVCATPSDVLEKQIVPQLFQPIQTNSSVSIIDGANPVDESMIARLLVSELYDEQGETDVTTWLRDYLSQTMLYYQPNMEPIDSTFMVQLASKTGLPIPVNQGNQSIVYTTAIDIIPVAKQYLAGNASLDEWITSLGFTFRIPALTIAMNNDTVFDNFKEYVSQQQSLYQSVLPVETHQSISDFLKISLQHALVEGVKVRNDYADIKTEQDGSFARFLQNCISEFVTNHGNECAYVPTSMRELITPTTIVFVNTDFHARATIDQIENTWKDVSGFRQIPMVGLKQLKSLRKSMESQRNMQQQIQSMRGRGLEIAKKAQTKPFGSQLKTRRQLFKIIQKKLEKMEHVARSNNSIKTRKSTFRVPNRREPNNPDKMGIVTNKKYIPDIHVYLDTSGSISEANYREACMVIIALAQKLKTKVYLNSFSTYLSQPVLLDIGNCTKETAWKRLQAVPKVSGGTEFQNVWDYIHQNNKRKSELSIMVTDFCDYPDSNYHHPLPSNLYYIPCGGMDINMLKRYAEQFYQNTVRLDRDLRQKIIF